MHDEPKVIIDLPREVGLTQPLQPRQILMQAGPYPSIAPSAIDVEPASWRPPPRRTNGLPIVLGVMGVCATLAAIAGVVGFHRCREKQKEDAAYAAKIADEDRQAAWKQSVETVEPPPAVTVAPVPTVDPIPTVKVDPPKPVAKPVVTAAPKPAVAKTETKQTGTLRTYSSAAGKAVFVDGKQVGVAPAPITVACGTHQIRVGDGKTRSVNVPCNGAITVGTPDGN